MDIRAALLKEHSKGQTMKIVDHIGSDPERFRDLMDCFLGDSYRLSQRAAWAVTYCAEKDGDLIKPYLKRLIEQLERHDAHPAIRRNVARTLQFIEIPVRYRGRVFDACYRLVEDIRQPVAVRVFAMTVAAQIAANEKVLLDELRLVASRHQDRMSAGFKSRFRRLFGPI
ncbi:MAG: HEAT repeat domain-containing protein [Chloracidobacterium sp.]|nr:HEAT repeat domain-containing protein [Chloracidobacterium sp.]